MLLKITMAPQIVCIYTLKGVWYKDRTTIWAIGRFETFNCVFICFVALYYTKVKTNR